MILVKLIIIVITLYYLDIILYILYSYKTKYSRFLNQIINLYINFIIIKIKGI